MLCFGVEPPGVREQGRLLSKLMEEIRQRGRTHANPLADWPFNRPQCNAAARRLLLSLFFGKHYVSNTSTQTAYTSELVIRVIQQEMKVFTLSMILKTFYRCTAHRRRWKTHLVDLFFLNKILVKQLSKLPI